MKSGADIIRGNVTQKDLEQYEEGWTRAMCRFWMERMRKLRIGDTGALSSSLMGVRSPGPVTTIEHSFLRYGIFVAAGTGPAHSWERWGNNAKRLGKKARPRMTGGQLEFLDPAYRQQNGLDEKKRVGPAWGGRMAGGDPKGRRDWFSKKYYSSVMRLNEFESAFYGDAYNGLLSSAIDEMFRKVGDARWL